LYGFQEGQVNALTAAVSVEVAPLRSGALEGNPLSDVVAFWRAYEVLNRDVSAMSIRLANGRKKANLVFKAAIKANVPNELIQSIAAVRNEIEALDTQVNGNAAKNQIGEKNRPIIGDRLFALNRGISTSTYGPTATHKKTMEIIKAELAQLKEKIGVQVSSLGQLAEQVQAAGGAWIE